MIKNQDLLLFVHSSHSKGWTKYLTILYCFVFIILFYILTLERRWATLYLLPHDYTYPEMCLMGYWNMSL